MTNVLNHGPDLRTSQSVVTVQDALAQTTNYAIVVNHLRVLDAFPPGAEVQSWTITGHDGSVPFTLRGGNRYADTYDIAGIAQWDLPDLVWALGFVPDVTIDAVTAVSTVTDDPSTFALVRVEQRLDGHWVKLNKDTPARVKAGKKLRLRMVLANAERQRHRPAQPEHPEQGRRPEGPAVPQPGLPLPLRAGGAAHDGRWLQEADAYLRPQRPVPGEPVVLLGGRLHRAHQEDGTGRPGRHRLAPGQGDRRLAGRG